LASTAVQIYIDYNNDLSSLDERFNNIKTSYLQSISTSLWDFNEPLVKQQIKGIVELPDIRYVKITTTFGKEYEFGSPVEKVAKSEEFKIFYEDNDIGVLLIQADYKDIEEDLVKTAGYIVTSEFIKIFIVALLIVFIVHWLITRHLFLITTYSKNLSVDNLDESLALKNRTGKKDELDILVDAINDMRSKIKDDVVKLEQAEDALLQMNGELEVKVYDRTSKLAESNDQLQASLDNLTLAKDQLVQSEKMASLGQLVAGVAHEVNTPLGICVTSISALKEKVNDLIALIESGNLTKSQLMSTLMLLVEYQQIIERSLDKAVNLIRGFKSVAVEQHTDPEININLSQHVNDIVNTVKTLFKRKKYNITIDLDEDLEMVTFPSAWNQILTNFLMNSHIHGFEETDGGNIDLSFKEENDSLVFMYSDNGKGLHGDIKNKIFDPFVTTKRGQGGTGLGMNIVFNLVDAKLGGKVRHVESDEGCIFEVIVPIVRKKKRLKNPLTIDSEVKN
jgi:signal transduction histidine kinase